MRATPPIVDRETWQEQIDEVRGSARRRTPVRATRSPPPGDDCRWSRSTRPRR